MRKVIELLPNITPDFEVLLFIRSLNYQCVEHYPFEQSELLGRPFSDFFELADIHLPMDCHYAYYRFPDYHCAIKENGDYIYIINSKICFPQHGQGTKN